MFNRKETELCLIKRASRHAGSFLRARRGPLGSMGCGTVPAARRRPGWRPRQARVVPREGFSLWAYSS